MSLKSSSWKALPALAVACLLVLGPAGGALASEGDTPEGAAPQDPTTSLVVEETTSAPEQAAEPESSEPVVEAPVAPAPEPAPKPVAPPEEAPTTNDSAAPNQESSTDNPSEVNANAPPTEEPLVAHVYYEMSPPTCEAPSKVTFFVENATWAHEPDRTPGTHELVFNANEGALFQGDLEEWTVTYVINPKLESQSTDPDGACYVPPVSVEPELVKAEFTSVCRAEGGAAMLNIDIQVRTDRQYLTVWVNYTKEGSGDIPTGVTLDEVTAPEGIKAYWASEPFEPGEYTFDIQFDGVTVEAVDVTVPECDEPEQPLVAHVYYEMSPPTCEAPSKVTFFIENAIWAHEPDQSVGTHTLEFDAVEGAMFPGDMATKSVTYTILPKLESQSTDPDGACYVPPTEEPENPTDPEDPKNPVKPEEPTKHEKPVNNTKTDATHLATTGPSDTNGLMTVGLLSLVAGAYLVLRKKFADKAAK